MEIKDLRNEIDKIDGELTTLFKKRMETAAAIAAYKKENNLPVYDKAREDFLINKNTNYIKDENLKDHYKKFLVSLMDISKDYQKENM